MPERQVPTKQERKLAVEPSAVGQRLDRYLAEALASAGLSRTRIARALKAGAVRLASDTGQVLPPAHLLRGDETLLLRADLFADSSTSVPTGELTDSSTESTPPSDPDTQEAAQLLQERILYEDEAVVVLDKPAGLVAHPAAGNPTGTLAQALVALGKTRPDPVRGGLVHRLDKGTSGVMVAARTAQAETHLRQQFAAHTIERRYLALVSGLPTPPAGRIDGVMTRDKHNRQKMALHRTALRAATRLKAMAQASPEAALSTTATQPKGKASHTQYRLRAELAGGQAALLELRPGTGRTHQIRVHCAALGHPVLGDSSYGGGARRLAQLIQSFAPPRKSTVQENTHQENTHQESSEAVQEGKSHPPEPRPLLHAWRLGFVHPVSGATLSFTAPPPADFCAILEQLDPANALPHAGARLSEFLAATLASETL